MHLLFVGWLLAFDWLVGVPLKEKGGLVGEGVVFSVGSSNDCVLVSDFGFKRMLYPSACNILTIVSNCNYCHFFPFYSKLNVLI